MVHKDIDLKNNELLKSFIFNMYEYKSLNL